MSFDTVAVGGEPDSSSADLPVPERKRSASRNQLILRRFLRTKRGLVGIGVLVILALWAIFGSYTGSFTYQSQDYNAILSSPNSTHWFGTDQIGHDLYQQTIRGLQKSLVIGLLAGPLGTLLAAFIGATGGYIGGWVDRVLRWVGELFLVIPAFFVYVIISPKLQGGSWMWFVLLLAGFAWMIMAQIIRNQARSLKDREYVRAARYMGVPTFTIIRRHIIPNVASLLIIDATLGVGIAIISETSLSYFGFGIQPPDVSLGTILAAGSNSATTYPWLFLFPAAVLIITVLATSLIGDALRDAVDPTSGATRG
jgi:peptide/nickel transport system permease protein